MLTVGENIKVVATDLDYQGQGVCKIDGYVLFVKGMLQDEEAIVKVVHIKKQFAQGTVVEILKRSPLRTRDKSELGSLDLYHLSIEGQDLWQEKITKETLKKIANIEVELKKTIKGNQTENYRNKVVFHALKKETHLVFGLYNNRNQLVKVNDFVLAHSNVNRILNDLNQKRLVKDDIVHIVFRNNQAGQVLVTIVAEKKELKQRKALVDFFKQYDFVVGLTLNHKDEPYMIMGRKSFVLDGFNEINETVGKLKLSLNDRSFLQTNTEVMRKVYEVIKKEIPSESIVVDAFSGIGSIGFYVSDVASSVKIIEINRENYQMAKQNQTMNDILNVELIKGDVFAQEENLKGDVLIVDPPRSGLNQAFTTLVNDLDYEKIIYLSCDLKTLTRDLGALTAYQIDKVYPIKMFYHTTETETLVILKRK